MRTLMKENYYRFDTMLPSVRATELGVHPTAADVDDFLLRS